MTLIYSSDTATEDRKPFNNEKKFELPCGMRCKLSCIRETEDVQRNGELCAVRRLKFDYYPLYIQPKKKKTAARTLHVTH
jgi:hypothetical protein